MKWLRNICWFPLIALLSTSFFVAGSVSAANFQRGDFNQVGERDMSDAIELLSYLFQGKFSLDCLDAGDTNDDGYLDVSDPSHLLRFLFLGTAPPPEPTLHCGEDPTDDALLCREFSSPFCEKVLAQPVLAEAPSQHYVVVSFDDSVSSEHWVAANYTIQTTDQVELTVVGVRPLEETRALLLTESQSAID